MSELQRFGIKLFAKEPGSLRTREFVPVFHKWIQHQVILGHLLIDIHDYGHIHNGPGVLLVAHEGNFSTDQEDGRLGLLYQSKYPAGDTLDAHIGGALKTALQACILLEEEPDLGERLRFPAQELLFIANDRLAAPQGGETMALVQRAFSTALRTVSEFTMAPVAKSPRERFAAHIQLSQPIDARTMLSRLK